MVGTTGWAHTRKASHTDQGASTQDHNRTQRQTATAQAHFRTQWWKLVPKRAAIHTTMDRCPRARVATAGVPVGAPTHTTLETGALPPRRSGNGGRPSRRTQVGRHCKPARLRPNTRHKAIARPMPVSCCHAATPAYQLLPHLLQLASSSTVAAAAAAAATESESSRKKQREMAIKHHQTPCRAHTAAPAAAAAPNCCSSYCSSC